jgi:tRNA A37 threonylcarbamoyladenosine dehydratase
MSQKLINRNADLKRLRDEGYELEIRQGYILIHSIPYVNGNREVKLGTLISELTLSGDITVKPKTHVIYFEGEFPCSQDGVPIQQIRHNSGKKVLADGICANHSFSNKPSTGYKDYHAKITQYIRIISHPANALDSDADPRTFKPIEARPDESVFKYVDTASSRAGIQAISEKLSAQRIAIVGLGGTGAYVLDFVAKTPVREIHLFDADDFQSHNAFRAPGAASLDDLRQGKKKVDYFVQVYSRMRDGIISHAQMIVKDTVSELAGFDFVFLCVDDGPCKKLVIDIFATTGTIIIDAGIDVLLVDQMLLGTCRVTTCSKSKHDHISRRISMNQDIEGQEYASNIQIVELNALNASLAIIKWKQLSGFYQDLEYEYHLTYSTNCALLSTDEKCYAN